MGSRVLAMRPMRMEQLSLAERALVGYREVLRNGYLPCRSTSLFDNLFLELCEPIDALAWPPEKRSSVP